MIARESPYHLTAGSRSRYDAVGSILKGLKGYVNGHALSERDTVWCCHRRHPSALRGEADKPARTADVRHRQNQACMPLVAVGLLYCCPMRLWNPPLVLIRGECCTSILVDSRVNLESIANMCRCYSGPSSDPTATQCSKMSQSRWAWLAAEEPVQVRSSAAGQRASILGDGGDNN